MKIYFTTSVTGLKNYRENYKRIIESLQRLDHTVVTELDLTDPGDERIEESLEQRAETHKKIMQSIGQADVIVAETSFPSTNVGYEITAALEKEKPVLVLHIADRAPLLLVGANYERLRVVEYSLDDLTDSLKMYLEDLSGTIDTRFNFFISPKHQSYLDWISKNKRIPRAVYLRRLIEKDMEKDEEYNQ